MIAKMKKVTLYGERPHLKKVIDTLKTTGSFQITFYKTQGTEPNPADVATRAKLQEQLNRVNSVLSYAQIDTKPITLTYQDLQNITKKQKAIDQLLDRLETAKLDAANLTQQINQSQRQIEQLQPFIDLPVDTAWLKTTQRVFVLAGRLHNHDWQRFLNDLGNKDFVAESYPTGKQHVLAVLTGALENLPIAETIEDYGWLPFPDNLAGTGTPRQQIDRLTTQCQAYQAKLTDLTKQRRLNREQSALLKIYHDYLTNELDTLDLLTATIQTKTCFVVHGWLPAKAVPDFTALLQRTNKNVVVEIQDATATDNPPALVHNSPFVAPYQAITAMYGAPAQTDLDPNPWVALFYFLFFGMMFGDVAYGLLLTVITGAILLWKRPRGGTKQLLGIFCWGGLSAAAWGLVFNSWFGLDLPSFILPQTLINPIGSDAVLFFALSLYLGVIQLAVGTLLNVVNQLRQKHWLGTVQALPHLVLFIGLTLAFPTLISSLITLDYAFLTWFTPLLVPGVILMVVGLAGMVLSNGLGHKIGGYVLGIFSGAYKVVNYFSDILSYARLFGVGLVGCVIGYVANYLFGMFAGMGWFGFILGAVIAVIFHAINIGLGLLSAYIHNARLQFVEFFGKFYAGTGTPFAPLGSQLRYTHLQGVGITQQERRIKK